MKILRTASGQEFDLLWDGVAFDGSLRLAIANADLDSIHNTFKLTSETARLTRLDDGIESVYTGFTGYRGFDLKPDGEVVVGLNAEV